MKAFTMITADYRQDGRQLIRWLLLAALITGSILLFSLRPSMTMAAVPDGLTAGEWESIQNQIAAAGYQFAPTADGYGAPNRAQGWQTSFGPDGAQVIPANGDWTWGLTLTGYGYGDALSRVPAAPILQAEAETVTYQWDSNLREWWVNRPDGLKQPTFRS